MPLLIVRKVAEACSRPAAGGIGWGAGRQLKGFSRGAVPGVHQQLGTWEVCLLQEEKAVGAMPEPRNSAHGDST